MCCYSFFLLYTEYWIQRNILVFRPIDLYFIHKILRRNVIQFGLLSAFALHGVAVAL